MLVSVDRKMIFYGLVRTTDDSSIMDPEVLILSIMTVRREGHYDCALCCEYAQ